MARRTMKRNRRRGGGFATGPAYVSAGNLEIQPNPQTAGADCLAATRPGMLPQGSYGGLPGMRGGRYGVSLGDSVLDPARGIVGGIPQAVRLPCESSASTQNPLNLRGGGDPFPVLNVGKSADMMAYHAPTAGYGNQMSTGGSVPLMLQVPYAAKSCLSGGKRRTKRHGKKGKRRAHKKTHRRRQ